MKRLVLILSTAAALAVVGVAVASHVTPADPATVPTGFLVAHNSIGDVPVSALARAVTPNGADVFIQHVRLGANMATGWHTHPGPAIVTVVKGNLTFEDAAANRCQDTTYTAGDAERQLLSMLEYVDATAEVERYIANPAQALSYKIGALTIQRLRRKAEAALGARFDIRAFHQQVLGSGALPLPVLEAKIDGWVAAR